MKKLSSGLVLVCSVIVAFSACALSVPEDDGPEFDRNRRITYYYPRQGYKVYGFANDEDEDPEFERKRRMTFHDIFRMPSQKFQIWKQSVDGDKKRSIEEVDDDEGFKRRRRIPYYYPRQYSYNYYEEDEDDLEEKKRAKRVVPYYYPKLSYSFLNRGPATTTPAPTTPGPGVTYAPEDTLYRITTDYHWPSFNLNQTTIPGNSATWKDEKGKGLGEGPFGFGSSVKFDNDNCMADSNFLDIPDKCQVNPKDCENGLSFSIWEKMVFDSDPLESYPLGKDDSAVTNRKYIISNGGQFDRETGRAWPGFSVYHQGAFLVAMVTTGEEVWELRVAGQLFNNTWTNIGVRWEKPNLGKANPTGGLELYVNLDRVGKTLLPETTKDGSPTFIFDQANFKINGQDPPVMSVGCHFDQLQGKYTHFSGAEYDELALWSRRLNTNSTHDETVFFFGGFNSEYKDVNPAQFKALLGNANLGNDAEAVVANEILNQMLLTTPKVAPPIPTRTTVEASATTKSNNGAATEATTTAATNGPRNQTSVDGAKTRLTLQSIMSTMQDTSAVPIVRSAEQVEIRFPLSVVAGKIISGKDPATVAEWEAVYQNYPHEEGATKTVREMTDYMLAWVSAVNTSDTKATSYYNPAEQTMKYPISGDDFVMNAEKLPPSHYRKSPRLVFPNYNGTEWRINRARWGNPQDTFSVPTGMFKDQENCADMPVTFVASIYNKLGLTTAPRRNPAWIRSGDWVVDSKIISTAVAANVQPLNYDADDVAAIAKCIPDPNYMKENPVRATLYHKNPGRARMQRRLLSFFTDNEFQVGGIEVRHCARWNPDFGSNGAWDPNGCTLKETDADKTTCECPFFGMMAVVMERSEPIEIEDDCLIPKVIKYIGIGVSVIVLIFFMLLTIGSKFVWDMFHVIRIHIAITWICSILFHVITDLNMVRDDAEINLIIGFIMKYFYTSTAIWITLDAHSHFKAFTSGIISGRVKVYIPFGYGAPFIPLGILFIVYHDDLGIDPRCFVGWNTDAKIIYLLFNLAISIVAVIFALIIVFNLTKPQTKRRNLISDLTSQARGTVITTFMLLILWIFASITYLHKQDSDVPDPYCFFVIYLGWFGVILFLLLGVMSKKFRLGMRGEKKLKEKLMPAYLASKQEEADQAARAHEDEEQSVADDDTASVISRPQTATSVLPPSEHGEENDDDDDSPNQSGGDSDSDHDRTE